MCIDPFDSFTSDRIAVGYATSSHGSCVREMISVRKTAHLFLSAFPMFVLSLSWQNDRFYI